MRKFLTGALLAAILLGCQSKTPQQNEDAAAIAQAKPSTFTTEALSGRWDEGVRQRLLQIINEAKPGPEQRPPVAVFDFDNTCIRGDIGRAFFDHMVTGMKIRPQAEVWNAFPADQRADLKAAWEAASRLPEEKRSASLELARLRKLMHRAYWSLCRESEAEKCFPWQVRFYSGFSPEEISRIAEQVFVAELSRPMGSEQLAEGPEDPAPGITATGIRVVPEIKSLIELLARRGFEVWIVSAGPQWVVAAGAKAFGIPSERVLGMRAKLDSQGRLTAEMEDPPTFRQGKAEAIKKFIGVRPLLAVGDSWADAEMLEYARHALLIDRGYVDLREKAEKGGWLLQPAFPTTD